ncbi:MAG: prepilin-type N-terminal cleavage/methylation domain-containing protein [Desulfuromonadaceae bacterium]
MEGVFLKGNKGFTLLELLIVLAISSVVLSAILQVFSKSQQVYNVQEDVAAMQQNVRTAKMYLERDIRMAGSGAMNLSGPNNKLVLPLAFENGHGATGTDRLTIVYDTPDHKACGPLTAPATILCSDLPTLTLAGTMPPSAATAEFEEELDNAPYNAWLTEPCSCNGFVYTPPNPNMPFLVTSPDKSRSAILVATHVSNNGGGSADNLGNGDNVPYSNIPGAEDLKTFLGESSGALVQNKQLNTFAPGSSIRFFSPSGMHRAVYYVDEDAFGTMGLYRDSGSGGELIAENIEDFQCSFEMADGTTVNNHDLTDAEIPDVRMVTINVLGRSGHQYRNQNGYSIGQRMALEDHGAGPVDGYRRRLLTVTVKIRNFGL